METDEIKRWHKYFIQKIENIQDTESLLSDFDKRFIEEIENPSHEEIVEIIKKLKNEKAPGPDNITAKLLNGGGPELWHRIYQLIDLVWEKQKNAQ
jgi:hypothetical protein